MMIAILTGFSDDENSRAVGHWIERCEWVENNAGEFYHRQKHFG
jgi:hypothetical protein